MAKPIILWRQSNGVLSDESPGMPVASTISEATLRRLALDGASIFVLEYSVDPKTGDDEVSVSRLWRGSDKHLEIWQKKQEVDDDTGSTNEGTGQAED